MDRLPLPSLFPTPVMPAVIGRRAFLKRCGMVGVVAVGVGLLGACASGGESESRTAAAPDSFFADGTDFVD